MGTDIIDLPPGARARGQAFGAARRAQILSYTQDLYGLLRSAGVADPESYIGRMLEETDFLPAIERHCADLLEEVRGIASGSGQPLESLLVSQFMDEEWAYRPRFLGRHQAAAKCSSVAIRLQDSLTWIGQNMDLGSYTDGHQLLLRIPPDPLEQGALIFTVGGMIGLLGVNARGVGVCVNSLPQLPAAREGLPVAFVIRKLLQASNLMEASKTVCAVPHATGQHYLIADPTGIRSFEASAAGVVEYRAPDPSRVLHTNHPLCARASESLSEASHANTVARLRSLTDRLMSGDPDLESIKAALSSCDDPEHPVCRISRPNASPSALTGAIGFTTGSMISALRRNCEFIDAWVSAGPPSERGYEPVQLPAALSR